MNLVLIAPGDEASLQAITLARRWAARCTRC